MQRQVAHILSCLQKIAEKRRTERVRIRMSNRERLSSAVSSLWREIPQVPPGADLVKGNCATIETIVSGSGISDSRVRVAYVTCIEGKSFDF